MSVNRRIASDSIKTTLATFVMQFVSFALSILVAQYYGATVVTDAYFFALAIPTLFTAALFGALKAVFVPVHNDYLSQHKEEEKALLGSSYSAVLLLSLAGSAVLYLLAPFLMPLVASGLATEGRELSINLARELVPLVVLSSLIGLMGTMYNAYQRFVIPLLAPITRTIVLFFFVIFFKDSLGIHALTFGTVFGEVAHLLVLIIVFHLRHIYFGFRTPNHPGVIHMMRLSLPPVASNFLLEFNPLIDKIMIASTAVGSVTALNIASKWNDIPLMLLSSGGFMAVILSHWSKLKAEEDLTQVVRSLEQSLRMVVFILMPFLTAFFVLRLPIISYFYGRKEFSAEAVANVATLWGFLILGVFPLLLGRILIRVYHVMQDTTTPFWIGLWRNILNVVFNFIFRAFFGLAGIAFSTSFTALILTVVNFGLLKRRVKELRLTYLLRGWGLMLLCALPAGLIVHLLYRPILAFLGGVVDSILMVPVLGLGVTSVLGGIVYLIMAFALRLPEAVTSYSTIVSSLRRRR